MRTFYNGDKVIKIFLEAEDRLEDMAIYSGLTMGELARRIEEIINKSIADENERGKENDRIY